jgi:hypothetical protein
MTVPTQEELLQAADVFMLSANSLLHNEERPHAARQSAARHAAAGHAASVKFTKLCAVVGRHFGMDLKAIARVAKHIYERRVPSDAQEPMTDETASIGPPSHQDALDVADIFFVTLNLVAYRGAREHTADLAHARLAAARVVSSLCFAFSEHAGADYDDLERTIVHVTLRRLASGDDGSHGKFFEEVIARFWDADTRAEAQS